MTFEIAMVHLIFNTNQLLQLDEYFQDGDIDVGENIQTVGQL